MSSDGPASFPAGRRQRLEGAVGEVAQVFREFARTNELPGLAWGMVVDDDLVGAGGVGLAERDSGRPATERSVFRIASMTKSVTAACVLMLRDEGRLHLDDPVAEHVPELCAAQRATSDSPVMDLRHLLTMSAGLVEDDPWADRQLAMSDEDFGALLSRGVALDGPPGIAYQYSNLGYAILGRVVANVAGQPLRRFAYERLLAPLGMAETTWDAGALVAPAAVTGYSHRDGSWIAEASLPDGAFGAMGGLATSVVDFCRYVRLQLSAWPARDDPDGGPLRRATLREMQQPWRAGPTALARSPEIQADGYGYGLMAGRHRRFGRLVAHSGGLPGFGSHVRWLPDRGVGVVAFANRTYAPVHLAVAEALEALSRSGGLAARTVVLSEPLALARDRALSLYEHWDDGLLRSCAAQSLLADEPLEHRRAHVRGLRERLGCCLGVEDAGEQGRLRASWRMRCQRGDAELSVWLVPSDPATLQLLRFCALEGGRGCSARSAGGPAVSPAD